MHLHRRILLSTESNGPHLSPPPPLSPSRQVPSHVIIGIASVGGAALFLALVYYAVLRHRLRRPSPSPSFAATRDAASDSDDHPFWDVNTVGLDDAAIESIGSYACRAGDRIAADNNCSVCLGEVLDGEIVRLLPKCGHVFHVQCIDTWLRCHVSCPVCRAAVGVAAVPSDVDGASSVEDPQSDGEEVGVRVSVENSPEAPESSEEAAAADGALGLVSLDPAAIVSRVVEEKEGNSSNCANCSKDDGSEKGQSESGRGFLFSRLGRARSSSVLPL